MNVRKRTIVLVVLVVVLMSLPFYSYEWSLFMHIFGAIVFVGNIIVTAVWMTFARRSGAPDILRFAVRGVIGTDVYFTTPGFLLVLLNGGILGTGWFRSGQASWIWTAIALFVLSGIVWFAVPHSRAAPDGSYLRVREGAPARIYRRNSTRFWRGGTGGAVSPLSCRWPSSSSWC